MREQIDLSKYKTLVFDCDGVILNSNKVKTQAFYKAALLYGDHAAQALVEYHVTHGGISRYLKFEYFLKQIVGNNNPSEDELKVLLKSYAEEVWKGLLTCEIAKGLEELRKKTSHRRWLLVSGGDQEELKSLFALRKIDHLFDGGIFGSPDDKEHILKRESKGGNIHHPPVFIGVSKYDYIAASNSDLDFIFVSGWSEFNDWQNYFLDKNICAVESIHQLFE